MSRDGSIEFEWADGTYRFRLGIDQLRELQEKTDAGPTWLWNRIEAGMYSVGHSGHDGKPKSDTDMAETIRLGLIGGGKTPDEARRLVNNYVLKRPIWEGIKPAQRILEAAVAGPEDEPLKKAEGATTETESGRSPTERSASPLSLETPL